MTILYGLVRTARDLRDHKAIEAARLEIEHMLEPVNRHLEIHPYLAGGTFGMADIPLGCLIYALLLLDVGKSKPAMVRRYEDRLLSRPAYREAVAIPLT